jgi:glucose/arabinose dehydrogenase
MRYDHIRRARIANVAAKTLPVIGALLAVGSPIGAQAQSGTPACPSGDSGITLPPAPVFADNIGHARHLVVAPNGVVYVNTWSGRYYGNDKPPAGGFLIALQDTRGNGLADVNIRFGQTVADGSAGGTGIALYNGALYAEVNDRIVRYALPAGTVVPTAAPEVIVSGLPLTGDHPIHPFAIDARGNMYVESGLAVAPDGALYISDDSHGRIWRVTFQGDVATTGIVPAPSPRIETTGVGPNVGPPEGIHPNAGAAAPALASLPVPQGATAAQRTRRAGVCLREMRDRDHSHSSGK